MSDMHVVLRANQNNNNLKKSRVGLLLATDDRIVINDSEGGRGVW